jgi:hypothetical protein
MMPPRQKMEPYESIYAGAFIFALGYHAGGRRLELRDHSVSLLAQNRGDEILGDVVSAWKGRTAILEFKRYERTVRSEFVKPGKRLLLERLAATSPESAALKALSGKGHFVGFGEVAGSKAEILIMPYRQVVNSPRQSSGRVKVDQFLHLLTKGAIGFSGSEFAEYAAVLKGCHQPAAGAQGGGGDFTISSLLLNYDPESRQLTFVVVDLLRVRELCLELAQSGPELSLAKDRGLSR